MDKLIPELVTDRLILKNIEEEDANFIVAIRSNPDVYCYFSSPHKVSMEEHLNWYKNKYLSDNNRIDWIAVDRITNSRVGIFGVRRENEKFSEVEVSYIIDPIYKGKGLASEATRTVINYALKSWNAESVIAIIHKDNIESKRFAKTNGFNLSAIEGDFLTYRFEDSRGF